MLFSASGQCIQAQWNNICQFDTQMNDLWFVDENTGYACGGYTGAKLMKTTDGGYTWEDVTPSEFTGPIYAMTFLNPSKGFLSWRDNYWSRTYLDRTTDAGLTWTVQYWTVPYINTICFPTSQTGYTFPSAMEYIDVVKTIDGGETWQRINFYTETESVLQVKDCSFPDVLTGYLVTGNGSVYKTSDGGFNLQRIYYDPSYSMTGVTFLSADTGFVTGYEDGCWSGNCGLLLRTTDGGASWEEQYFDHFCHDICFTTHDTGYVASFGIYKTTDGGNTWQPDTCNYYASVSKIHFPGNDIGYALASAAGGTAVMKRDPGIGVFIQGKAGSPDFSISPVPANSDLIISLRSAEKSVVKVDLVDQQGKVIRNFYNGTLPNENIIIHQDVSGIPAGLYFCRILTNKSSAVKKIVIG